MLIERFFTVLEEATDERFVDDCDLFRSLIVGCCKVPSPNERHTEILEIVGAYAIPRRARLFAWLRRRAPSNENELAPVIGERVIEGKPGTLDPWEPIQALLDIAIERGQFIR